VGQSFLTAIVTHVDAPGVEHQVAYLRELAPQSRFVVCYGGERSEFDRLSPADVEATFIDDARLGTYGDISLNQVVATVHERWVADDPEIELVYFLEFDLLILRPDFEEALAGMAARSGAGMFGKAAGPRNDTNWPHYLRLRRDEPFNSFVERVSTRDDRAARLGSFGPGMLFRRDAFVALASVIREAPPMMQEVLLPTLVHHLGFAVADVNELGDLYAAIRWRPVFDLEEAIEAKRAGRTFLHPFKRMDQLGALLG
jgi:hypothetical protein